MTHVHHWNVIVPLRGSGPSKTRLLGADQGQGAGRALSFAFMRDVVATLSQHPAVSRAIVLTGHAPTRDALIEIGIEAELEQVPAELNDSIAWLSRSLRTQDPDRHQAVFMADLPALRLAHVDAVLTSAAHIERAVLGDRAGTGSCFLTAAPPLVLDPHFGVGSLAEHLRHGCTRLDVPVATTAYSDVDTLDDLRYVSRLGLGPYTKAVLASLERPLEFLSTVRSRRSETG